MDVKSNVRSKSKSPSRRSSRKSRAQKPCKSNQVRNPSTGRCRNVEKKKSSKSKKSIKKTLKLKTKECVICLNNPVEVLAYPCGHYCYCKKCSNLLLSKGIKFCSICKENINGFTKVYTC